MFVAQVGYLCASIKAVGDARVGDTITLAKAPAAAPLAGYARAVPMVYSGLFPVDADQYELLRDSLAKLSLNDAALQVKKVGALGLCRLFSRCAFICCRCPLLALLLLCSNLKYEPEVSTAMGFGFRCGFLGLLHMDIVQERLEREYDLDLIITAPSVVYEHQVGTYHISVGINRHRVPGCIWFLWRARLILQWGGRLSLLSRLATLRLRLSRDGWVMRT